MGGREEGLSDGLLKDQPVSGAHPEATDRMSQAVLVCKPM